MIPDVCVSMVIHHYFGIKNLKIWDLKDMYQTENSTAQSSGEGQAITKKKIKIKRPVADGHEFGTERMRQYQ